MEQPTSVERHAAPGSAPPGEQRHGFLERFSVDVAEREWPWIAATIVFFLLRFHVILAAPLLGAEGYYWDWGQHPAWGYFDHPPGVAVMIRLTSALFGNTNLGVRFGPLILGAALPFLVRWIAGMLYGKPAGRTAAFLSASAPLVVTAGVLATPDIPVTVLFLLALGTGIVAARRWSPFFFLFAGLLTGFSILAKFNGFELIFILGLLWILEAWKSPPATRWFPLLGCVGLLVLIPYLQWNAGHGWVTFKYLFWGRHQEAGKHLLNWTGPLEFVGDFFTLGPLLGALMLITVYRWVRTRGGGQSNKRRVTELVIYILPLAGFLVLSLKISMAPHWVGQILLIGLMATAGRYLSGDATRSEARAGGRRLLVLSATANIVLCVAVYILVTNLGPLCRLSAAMGVPIRGSAVSEFFGWREFAEVLREEIAEVWEDGKPVFIMAPHHRIASLARFYAGGDVYASVIDEDRLEQFQFWPRPKDLPGSNGVYVDKKYRESRVERVREQFRIVGEPRTVTVRVGEAERSFYFWPLGDSVE